MKKFLSLVLAITSLSLLATINIASAAPAPLTPSMAVTEFEKFYTPSLDQINTDMKAAREMVRKEWEPDADLYQFNIWFGQGESTYAFIFISEPNKDEAYHVLRTLDGQLTGGLIGRKPEWKYNFSGANLILRNMLPLLKADPIVLPYLDKAMGEQKAVGADEIWVNFTLRTNLNGRVKWFLDFNSHAAPGEAKEYQVIAPADKRWDTTFYIRENHRIVGEV
ncbi:hypothetical protein IT413_06460 [Candidatus Peregrinibacteria bacterium]|nr:hypothetical protein [Candidatus Peregrinibacteria bacterium]